MKSSVWGSTLKEFQDQVASRQPVPASACVSAVSATLALNLLVKVLEITANKKGFDGNPERRAEIFEAAKAVSVSLARYADEDVAAFSAYLKSARLPKSGEEERDRRTRAMAAALEQTIQVPLQAARSAAAGIKLCAGAIPLIPISLIADLGAAAALLAGSARGLILSAEFNVRQMATDQDAYNQVAAQLQELEREISQREDLIRRQVASVIAGEV